MSSAGPSIFLQSKLAAMFARMQALNVTEDMQVFDRIPLLDSVTGKPVGRELRLLGTINVWQTVNSGSEQTGQEGQRQLATCSVYFFYDAAAAALLTADNYIDRWVKLAADNHLWRINGLFINSQYATMTLETGSTADRMGNVR